MTALTKHDWKKLDADRAKVLQVADQRSQAQGSGPVLGSVGAAVGESVRLLRGDAVPLEPVRWLVPGYLPLGMLALIGGAPGCGKTTILLSIAAQTTRGTAGGGRWPDGSQVGEAGDVLICSTEDTAGTIAARLRASGADMSRVHIVDRLSSGDEFDPARDMPLLEAEAEKLPALRLLILDPIVSAVAGDSHKGAEVRRDLAPVVAFAKRIGCAVVGITHFSKGTSGRDPVERVTGSIAFAALARVVMVAAKVAGVGDDEPRRVLMRAKSNIGPDDGGFAYELERVEVAPGVEGQRVRWLEALEGSAREMLTDAETQESEDKADVDGFIRGLLADGPVPVKAIKADADGAGYSWDQVKRASLRIGVEKRKESLKGGWLWSLVPDSARAPSRPPQRHAQAVIAQADEERI